MGTLRITIDQTTRVAASSARVHTVVSGSSALLGNAALARSEEVRGLVHALAQIGVTEESIEVDGVRLHTRSGRVGRSQSIEILLTISALPDRLPALLGVLADQPNLRLEHLEWVFDGFEASIEATAAAMVKARRKADAVARAAGREITGVTMASDSWNIPSARVELAAQDVGYAAKAMAAPLDLGVDIASSEQLFIHLTVDFEMSS
ncbi:MAG: SIMPL domain-containing protein [Propionibacteriaceae bacterium]|nr:SIMPL domain-containing protein [Propionibacteriaceae bacterium]